MEGDKTGIDGKMHFLDCIPLADLTMWVPGRKPIEIRKQSINKINTLPDLLHQTVKIFLLPEKISKLN